ncbi:uncharacterized protein LOC142563301 [Dermacentor variabilis]|uniref:uncharacterized protein LOC142563301 n=1 Tax=Dermacentor variabilis TaxID=34621 RepID=UPI003F5C6033
MNTVRVSAKIRYIVSAHGSSSSSTSGITTSGITNNVVTLQHGEAGAVPISAQSGIPQLSTGASTTSTQATGHANIIVTEQHGQTGTGLTVVQQVPGQELKGSSASTHIAGPAFQTLGQTGAGLDLKKAYDARCKVTVDEPSSKCDEQRWYFDRTTRKCRQSCSKMAPFKRLIDCDGICRSTEACDFPITSYLCLWGRHPVYVFHPTERTCVLRYDCTYYGNKFPTLGECQRTCRKKMKKAVPASGDDNNTVHASETPSTTPPPLGQPPSGPPDSATDVKTG